MKKKLSTPACAGIGCVIAWLIANWLGANFSIRLLFAAFGAGLGSWVGGLLVDRHTPPQTSPDQ